jgi:hypothetical protein
MDFRTALAKERPDPVVEPETCPRCAAEWESQPPVAVSGMGGVRVRRCLECGARSTTGAGDTRWLFTCGGCTLPFLHPEPVSGNEQRCPDCREGKALPEPAEPEVVAATEAEIRAALGEHWSFLASSSVSDYLDRMAKQLAARIEGAPLDPRIVLVDDARVLTLSLPSGTLLLSLGALESVEDEAELMFVIGHELAHAAQGDAAGRLVRQGLLSVSRDDDTPGQSAWVHAVEDLVRLGYGRERENEADARSLQAVHASRYDPQAALRYLSRIESRMRQGDEALAAVAVSHPTPGERRQRLEQLLQQGPAGPAEVLKVNREVFRRAAGPEVLRDQLRESTLDAATRRDVAGRRRLLKVIATVLGVSLLAALILAAALLLAG